MDVLALDTLLNIGEAENAGTIMVTEIISVANREEQRTAGRKSASRITYDSHELPVIHLGSILIPEEAEFPLPESDMSRNERILVVTTQGVSFGLKVDSIEGIRRMTIYRSPFPTVLLTDIYYSF